MPCTFDLKMPIEVFDAADQALTLGHVGTGAESDSVAFFAGLDRGMRFVGIAPGSNPVNEGFELAGNVCPVGRCDGHDDVSFVEFVHDVTDDLSVFHHARSGLVAGAAPFAESKRIIVYADAFGIVTRAEFTVDDIDDLGCGAVSYGTAVND